MSLTRLGMRYSPSSVASMLAAGACGVVVIASGCATVNPADDLARARELISASTGLPESVADETVSNEEIDRILDGGLTLDSAMRIALLNNRRLRAQFQRIGIAHADLVQSRLLRNPAISLAAMFPTSGGRSQIEGSILQAISDLWQIPLRTETAGHVLDEAILRTARAAGELVADVRIAYHRVVASDEIVSVAEENLRLRQRAAEAVERRFDLGEADGVDLSLLRSAAARAEVELAQSRLDAAAARRELARLLAIDERVDRIVLLDGWPADMREVDDLAALVQHAREHRLDVRAARSAARSAESAIALARRGALPGLGLGVGVERPEIAGSTLVGPAIEVTLPILDQGHAQAARAYHAHVEAINLHEALYIEVAHDIRDAFAAVQTAATTVAIYTERVVVETQRAADLAMQAYKAGEIDVLTLLESQGMLLEAQRELSARRLAGAIAVAELERAVGWPIEALVD